MKYLIEAFLLGITVGPICIGTCSPIIVPLIISKNNQLSPNKELMKSTGFLLINFLLGRFVGYIFVGALVGLIGTNFYKNNSTVEFVATILIGILLLTFGAKKTFPTFKICKILNKAEKKDTFWGTFNLGLLTGLNFCPPFLIAISSATMLNSISMAIGYFIAFFIGTAVFFPPIVLFGFLAKHKASVEVSKIFAIIIGVWFILKGLLMLATSSGS